MTIPYGVTVMGITNQFKKDCFSKIGVIDGKTCYKIKQEYIDNDKGECLFNSKDIYALANVIHGVLFDTYPSMKNVVNYLKQVNKLFKDLGANFNVF